MRNLKKVLQRRWWEILMIVEFVALIAVTSGNIIKLNEMDRLLDEQHTQLMKIKQSTKQLEGGCSNDSL